MQKDDRYFVETGEVLKNKLGITDQKKLESCEYDITSLT